MYVYIYICIYIYICVYIYIYTQGNQGFSTWFCTPSPSMFPLFPLLYASEGESTEASAPPSLQSMLAYLDAEDAGGQTRFPSPVKICKTACPNCKVVTSQCRFPWFLMFWFMVLPTGIGWYTMVYDVCIHIHQ